MPSNAAALITKPWISGPIPLQELSKYRTCLVLARRACGPSFHHGGYTDPRTSFAATATATKRLCGCVKLHHAQACCPDDATEHPSHKGKPSTHPKLGGSTALHDRASGCWKAVAYHVPSRRHHSRTSSPDKPSLHADRGASSTSAPKSLLAGLPSRFLPMLYYGLRESRERGVSSCRGAR